MIARNAGRREKRLWTDAGAGELIVGYVADNEHDEARFVAEEIDALAEGSEITYNDVAVFYRTNNSSRSLEEVLIRAGIPYKVVGGVRFYERKEIRDIVAYLRVLDNPGDAVSLRRILNTPRRGIGIVPRRVWRCTPRTPASASVTRSSPRPKAKYRC